MSRAHAVHNMSAADYWLECDHWYGHKKCQIDAGTYESKDSDASLRGNALHSIIEKMIEAHVSEGRVDAEQVETELLAAQARLDWSESDLVDAGEQISIAFRSVRKLLDAMPDAQVLVEMAVPLAHERESEGYVDLTIIDPATGVYFTDHKFGQGRVDPDSHQNHGYAANGLAYLRSKGFDIPPGERIYLGINQPRHATEIAFHETTEEELADFQKTVETRVARQKSGFGLQSPETLETCQWCDFRTTCSARKMLIGGMLSTVEEIAAAVARDERIEPALVERIVRERKTIESVIEECVERVKADPETFPDWKRITVGNGRAWDAETMDLNEIVRQLRGLGAQNPFELISPSAVEKRYPETEGKLDGLTVDKGFHVRLKYTGSGEKAAVVEEVPTQKSPPPPAFIERVQKAMAAKKAKKPEAVEEKPVEPAADQPADPFAELVERAKKRAFKKPAEPEAPPVERGRGRPRKEETGPASKVKRPRGRPTKERALTTLEKAQREILAEAQASVGKQKKTKN